MPTTESSTEALLRASLSAAVPLWVLRLRDLPWSTLQARAQACSAVVAAHGDNILYRSKRAGDTAQAFNALAEALAVLSFVPGGVNFLGEHYEADK